MQVFICQLHWRSIYKTSNRIYDKFSGIGRNDPDFGFLRQEHSKILVHHALTKNWATRPHRTVSWKSICNFVRYKPEWNFAKNKSAITEISGWRYFLCLKSARDGTRTCTAVRPRDFKSLVSTISPPGLFHGYLALWTACKDRRLHLNLQAALHCLK